MINVPDAVMILAMTETKKFVLIRQFRPALKKYTLEVPAAIVRPFLSSNFAIIPQFLVLGRFFNQI